MAINYFANKPMPTLPNPFVEQDQLAKLSWITIVIRHGLQLGALIKRVFCSRNIQAVAAITRLVALSSHPELQQIQHRQLRNDRSILRAGSTKEQVGSNAGFAVQADNSL